MASVADELEVRDALGVSLLAERTDTETMTSGTVKVSDGEVLGTSQTEESKS